MESGSVEVLQERTPEDIAAMLALWERSVRATHDFLAEADIREIRPMVEQGLSDIAFLVCVHDREGKITGFLGQDGDKVEMLFIDDAERGKGLGRALFTYAVDSLGARFVDVNEQNFQGAAFYRRMGFTVFDRSERDEAGRPFPLLHMRL